MDDLQEVIDQGKIELEHQRAERLEDIMSGDVEIDPELLDIGDEVAEEVVSAFKRAGGWSGPKLVENRGKGRLGAQASPFSDEEQRAAAQRAMDIVLEQLISPTKAYAIVGSELGLGSQTVATWARKHGLAADPMNARSMSRGPIWDLLRREQLFDELLDVAQILTTRMKVWIQYNPANPDSTVLPPPEDWNAANELKTIAVAAAIAHDKRSGIEDLKVARGIRDIDSEELQGELSAGRERLLGMGVRQPE